MQASAVHMSALLTGLRTRQPWSAAIFAECCRGPDCPIRDCRSTLRYAPCEVHAVQPGSREMREGIAGRANVEDTPELHSYYKELERFETAALWTVANKIEPWEPASE